MGRVLNSFKDRLGFNRGKVKVTYYDEYNKENDLRVKIVKGKLELEDQSKEGHIKINAKVNTDPLWDNGPRYVVVHGLTQTINPVKMVRDQTIQLEGLEEQGASELFESGVKWGQTFAEKTTKDLLKYVFYAIIGVAILSVGLFYIQSQEWVDLFEKIAVISGNINTIHDAVVASA